MSIDPVIGVDFSGAKQDANTWMASGVLRSDGLQVNDIRSVTRDELLALLRAAPEGAVASVDFPFSVPQPFANVLAGSPNDMADVWAGVADMSMEEFIALRDTFVAEHGEMRRECDLSHGEAFSVLHKANPNMLPMTLRGMQMLHRLQAPRCAHPLPRQARPSQTHRAGVHARRDPQGAPPPLQGLQERPQARRATPTHPRRLGISCAGAASQRRGGRRAVPSRPRRPRCRCGGLELGGVHDLPRGGEHTAQTETSTGWKGGFTTSSQYQLKALNRTFAQARKHPTPSFRRRPESRKRHQCGSSPKQEHRPASWQSKSTQIYRNKRPASTPSRPPGPCRAGRGDLSEVALGSSGEPYFVGG